jgi:hypothetical protein
VRTVMRGGRATASTKLQRLCFGKPDTLVRLVDDPGDTGGDTDSILRVGLNYQFH